jgi:asparagine synthase (glutamine-hydrolysing)
MIRPPDLAVASFSWFVVLPDAASAFPVGALLNGRASRRIDHPSGRPWLLGSWPEHAVAVGTAGPVRVVMIGQHATTAAELASAAGRARTPADLDGLARSSVGSAHLLASVAGRVRVQGTVTGIRRVFHARSAGTAGITVAADRADVLAWLIEAPVDRDRLAVHLLDPPILYPLAGQPVWRGVQQLPTDQYLILDGDRDGHGGGHRRCRWWSPPEPVVPMAEGAPALRDALSAAVAARTRDRDVVSCDLGGLDSTAVCSVAARCGQAQVVAYTAASQDPLADDVYWASRTVAGLGNVEHHVIPETEMPLVYHGLHGLDDLLDEPCAAATDRDRWLVIARRAAERGSRLHLTGFGGDELLYGSLAHLHALIRTNPVLARRQLRGFAAKYRWPWGRVLSQLWDRSSYAQWLVSVAEELADPPPPLEEPLLEWGFRPRLPPWVTPAAAEAVRGLVRAEAAGAQPLAGGRGQHRELETMRFVSRIARQLDQLAGRFGVALAAPYYDDRVIEAGLAVRPQDRITPWRYKPLITEAMQGIVPEASRVRQTKANGTCDEDTGLRRHRADLLALWEDSRLARLGLVDAAALAQLCARPMPAQLQIGVLYQTVACELWLRSLERVTTPS